jgi:hypothetical protein
VAFRPRVHKISVKSRSAKPRPFSGFTLIESGSRGQSRSMRKSDGVGLKKAEEIRTPPAASAPDSGPTRNDIRKERNVT